MGNYCYLTPSTGPLKGKTIVSTVRVALDDWMQGKANRVVLSTGSHNIILQQGYEAKITEALLWKDK